MILILQIILTSKAPWIANESNEIDSGIDAAPTKRSIKATLDSKMFEFVFNSHLVFTAAITKRFNRTVRGQVMVVMVTVIFKEVV